MSCESDPAVPYGIAGFFYAESAGIEGETILLVLGPATAVQDHMVKVRLPTADAGQIEVVADIRQIRYGEIRLPPG